MRTRSVVARAAAERPEPCGRPGGGPRSTVRGGHAACPRLALLVVLESLDPAERLAFMLHDTFAVPFEEIAPIVGRTPAAARQLASRARRRVQGAPPAGQPDRARQRAIVDAWLAAHGGRPAAVLALTVADGLIVEIDILADLQPMAALHIVP